MTELLKNSELLTTQELSKYLKLNEKTVLKLAQTGEIPGFKIGNQWRFYLSSVDEYLQDNIVNSDSNRFEELITADTIPLSRLTDTSSINLHLAAESKEEVLLELAGIAFDAGIVNSKEAVFEKLLSREKMLSTAIGKGVAVPHPRNPSDELFSHPFIIIGRSDKGIYLQSPDEKKVHLFFMPCATGVVMHLKLLSMISKFLKRKNVILQFMKAKSKQDIIKILLENERVDLHK